MILPCLLPLLLLALPTAALTQTSDQTSTTAACTSRFGYYTLPLNTNAAVPTWYTYITSTSTTRLTTSTYSTVTSTYNATTTTQLDVLTSTATVLVTSTQTPEVFVVPTPAGFIPLTNHVVATPSPIPRIQRAAAGLSLPQSNSALAARQNRTPANYTGGFFVDRNGQTNSLDRKYLHRVNCVVSVGVSSTEVVLVSGVPETVYVAGPTEAVVEVVTRTSTVRVTSTVLEVEPRETVWEACGAGNVGM
ncbi:hypothetical protein BDW02DRAFT_386568 [Decorospora gaudefroyi]|uniref:Uncharacterized protein n=1 Tax=Decorospora gaudefroyi TaxID=184978 RepID=A0A6A5KDX5_9PLEO|nr:hypothetical protein BDW02DRAFT_386568 [Decorospora gaudefroyi]